MPLNRLDNFIKNTEGRILYVSPSDLNATDSVSNQGNSLSQPFKTIQRALLESARFSYIRGNDNDITERTTILLLPGEHPVDNRPGYAIYSSGGVYVTAPNGTVFPAENELSLTLTSNFDLNQRDNILYKFNSVNGGVIVPRGTSIVGLDLRKTKIRPKYVPNPTDSAVPSSAIFRITGACYFWQFSIFDGDETGLVYTDRSDFSIVNSATPTFSHHKLTCFEYADGFNTVTGYSLTDLDMYYSKVSNAFNAASGRDIDQKYPTSSLGFAKQRPEWEIVGAFASDPIRIISIVSGDGFSPTSVITVTTATEHGLNAGTPIKINGVTTTDYNISTKVQTVLSATQFTYLMPAVRANLPATPSPAGSTVTIESDTVSGASPYVFNCSLRSVWGMNGMHADGAKASGLRSMVVAQFTGVSLQKDDRAFVKYDPSSRIYKGISPINKVTGPDLSSGATSTDITSAYHLDSDAIYRSGWETSHIKLSNDAFIQVVSVFAIGYNKHFDAINGGDASITNSNSNFGQISLNSSGFKKEAFEKDNHAVITSIIAPRAITASATPIDWISLDVGLTTAVGISSHLYLYGFTSQTDLPPTIIQGYRVGSKVNDQLYLATGAGIGGTVTSNIYMTDSITPYGSPSIGATISYGTNTSEKSYQVSSGPTNNVLTLGSVVHGLQTGETIRIFSDDGDLPENITANTVYYVIYNTSTSIKVATSPTNATLGNAITIYGGTKLKVVSRVSDKSPGSYGHPIQYDTNRSNWYVHVNRNNDIFNALSTYGVGTLGARSNVLQFYRTSDGRGIDEKIYKLRVFIPKEIANAKDPTSSFVIQESSKTGFRSDTDPSLTVLGTSDFEYGRNPRFISSCTYDGTSTITVTAEQPHCLFVGDKIIVKNVVSSTNTSGADNSGYNGTFLVSAIPTNKIFRYSSTDTDGVLHTPGTFTSSDQDARSTDLPRWQKADIQSNYYIYRNEVITPYIEGTQDGIYHLYVLNSRNTVPNEFTSYKYAQNVVDLFPQLDNDNVDDNPQSAKSFAKRAPLGDVVTNDLKKSITKETLDYFLQEFGIGIGVSLTATQAGITTVTFIEEHNFSGIVTYSSFAAGSGKSPGTYYNVKLFNNAGLTSWNGATSKVVVSAGGTVTSVDITSPGSGYSSGTLYLDTTKIGGAANATITVATSGISTNIGQVVQFTGVGTITDTYARIVSVPSGNTISIARTSGDQYVGTGQYAFLVGPSAGISTIVYNSTVGVATFTTTQAHGLLAGNRFRVLTSTNNNVGDYIVKEASTTTTFSATTNNPLTSPSIASGFILKHGLSANDAVSDSTGENIGVRDVPIFGSEILTLNATLTNSASDTSFSVISTAGIGTYKRFPLGSYIQIDAEIMRVASSTLSGVANDKLTVLRGALGTNVAAHTIGSLIRRINPIAIEFRRPSILRASGQTFEYLGYGPGNYSTGLPQVQVKTLSEREAFLVQSQQRSAGVVVYTGMNNDGDFFIGNTKYSASSGEQTTFAIPTPSVTGQDPNRLSVIYDEVTVRERLLVQGGNSGTILSQFNGPVTFDKELKMNGTVTVASLIKETNTSDSTTATNGSVVLSGGVGILKNANVGANISVGGTSGFTGKVFTYNDLSVIGVTTLSNNLGVVGVATFYSSASFNAPVSFNSNLTITGNSFIKGSLGVSESAGNGNRLNITSTTGGAVFNQQDTSPIIFQTDSGTERLRCRNTAAGGGVLVTGTLDVTGDISAFYTSDQRLKDNITPIPNALSKVLSISCNTFDWNENSGKTGTEAGVIAQEILEVLPEAVTTRDNGYLAVKYDQIVPLLIEAIKELKAEINELKGGN
jgi:hypothetical protein